MTAAGGADALVLFRLRLLIRAPFRRRRFIRSLYLIRFLRRRFQRFLRRLPCVPFCRRRRFLRFLP